MNRHTLSLATIAVFASSATLDAQSRPAIRQLGAVKATTTDSLGMVSNIRALPGGRLLINDVSSRRVLLVDSSLKLIAVVADSTPSTANAYGPRPGTLIAYRGDSTLFVDPASLSMLVIDPQGKIGRVMSVPRSQDAGMMSSGLGAYYSNGHLVYRGGFGLQMRMAGAPGSSGGAPPQMVQSDTAPVVRVNLQTRVVDTMGYTKMPKTNTNMQMVDGKMNISIEVNPLPVIDEWVVTSKGDVAFIRGKDYHVDYVGSDKQVRSAPKVAFDWKRLTDEDKAKFVDSVTKILEKQFAATGSNGQALQQGFQQVMGGAAPGAAAAGAAPMVMRFEMSASGGGPGGPVRAPTVTAPKMSVVPASELPDYQPAFFSGSARADQDGNVWIRTIPTKPQPAGEVYDVLNDKGEAVDRVLIPEGRAILGFGTGGIVYLAKRVGLATTIERATLK